MGGLKRGLVQKNTSILTLHTLILFTGFIYEALQYNREILIVAYLGDDNIYLLEVKTDCKTLTLLK